MHRSSAEPHPRPIPLGARPRRPGLLALLLASTALGLPGAAFAQVVSGPVVNAGAVNAAAGDLSEAPVPGATTPPTQQQLFQSGETTRVLDQFQLEQAGPVGGGAQAIGVAPGAQVVGYGASGATKYTVQLDGLANGWGGFGGYTGNNNLMMTFDGVPMNNVATGLWASATIPQIGMIQNINVTYGPGEAANRWYDSTGGTIEFTPIQPTQKAGADVYLSYGSFDQQNLNFDIRTGNIDGWSSVIAGGLNEGNDFRQSPNGFQWPSEDYAIYAKTIKNFSDGDLSFGAYLAQGAGYRPNVIPLTPTKGIGLYGANTLPLYSEAANFYEALSSDVWAKFDMDQFATVYTKQNIHIDDYNTFHNMAWYSDEQRLHSDFVNYTPNYNQMYEYNNPENWTLGDKIWMTTTLPFNTLDYGGYYIHSYYQTENAFWNPFPPYFGSRFEPNGNYRNGLFYNDDLALFVQDDIHPISGLHITPSLRVVNDSIQFANGTGPYGAFPNATGNDQDKFGSQHANYVGVEPGVDVNYAPLTWLAFYGGYEQAYQTPTVGGGGGYFQAIPVTQNSTSLELAEYYQAGAKIHFDDALDGYLKKFLLDVNWFDLRLGKQVANATFFNGAEVTTFGNSDYRGVNIALDDNVFSTVHLFFNGAVMNAVYQSYYNGTNYFNGSHVPYVPDTTLDMGVEYTYNIGPSVVKPKLWWQYTGEQYFFNNATVAPSNTTMAAYNTLNLAIDAQVPFEVAGYGKKLDFSLALLNVTNNKFNIYEYESAGGYFSNGSPVALGYPGAPLTVYGTVGISF
jgi:iron complex outermembrane receptor protein